MSEQADAPRNVIVVGADMADTGVFALQEAMRLAGQLPNAVLHAVNVVAAPGDLHDAKKIEELSEQLDETRRLLREHVSEVCRLAAPSGAIEQQVVLHVRLGQPAAAILQVATDEEADMLVVGTHGRVGVKRLVMGSVAEELLRTSHCPVVVAHPKDYQGLTKTARVDPPRPGQDLHGSGYTESLSLRFPQRTSHISGLI